MNRSVYLVLFFYLILNITSCSVDQIQQEEVQQTIFTSAAQNYDEFGDYWYRGKAEITSYKLEQARYGEVHPGHAVLVFVTEDFSKSKQVKLDFPTTKEDRIPVIKLNFVKKFNTGIYPYSMMQSVFSPVNTQEYPHTLKTSMSSQEWCGHTFTQFNLQKKIYKVTGLSYFESEGDEQIELPIAWLEDEIWTRIRTNPQSLPIGTVSMIPGSFYLRLKHRAIKAEKAEISLQASEADPTIMTYKIYYPQSGRTLSINYEQAFPYKILGWEETSQGRSGSLKTKATLMKQIQSAYWSKNRLANAGLRKELGLN